MNFHCMIKSGLSSEELKDLFKYIDQFNYKSVLLTFSSQHSDYMIKASNAYSSDQTTPLMFAVRPYAMSPKYLSMMLKSFKEITGSDVMINIIAGTFDSEADIFVPNTSIEDRKAYAGEFVDTLRKYNKEFDIKSKIYFSGSSEKTISNVVDHGDGVIMLLSDYLNNKETIDSLKAEKIIRVFLIVSETDDLAKKKFDSLDNGREKENCIYGTKDSILKQLSEIGCSDYLISGIPYDHWNMGVNNVILHNNHTLTTKMV